MECIIMKKILFQGDSITDAGRNRDFDPESGYGYATLVKASIGLDKYGEYEFINKGIGGNRIIDLLARVKCDIINLKPDVMSILIGVNDVWHRFAFQNGVSTEKFEKYYCMLIEEIKEALPDTKIIILEPFVLKGLATEENWNEFRAELEEKAVVSKRAAEKYNLKFIELLKPFDELSEKVNAEYWLGDGIHPTAAGHEFIKREWIKAFEEL